MAPTLALNRKISALAPGPDPSSTAVLSRCSGRLDAVGLGFELPASLAPTPTERGALSVRAESLGAALQPAGREEAARMVAALFAVVVKSSDGAELREQIALYAAMLADYPIWAIASACRGHVEAGEEFRPAVGALIKRARAACATAQEERAKITRLLGARIVPEVDAAERARVAAAFRQRLLAALEAAG